MDGGTDVERHPEDASAPGPAESPGDEGTRSGVTHRRLLDQIDWYDRKSIDNQRWFKRLKGLQLVAAAAVPVVATLAVDPVVTGGLGAVILVLEGMQGLNQYQQNWISYRSTCEALRHERYLFEATAGPYAKARRPTRLLAERIEGLISRENDQWVHAREEAAEQLSE